MKRNCTLLALLLLLAFAAAAARPAVTREQDDLADGKKLYDNQCALCHGIGGTGGRGPALNQPKLVRATTEAALFNVIRSGLPDSEMPGSWMLNEKEIRQIAAYVRALGQLPPAPLTGDATRGQALYKTKGNCAACHIVGGTGGVAGPDLTDIGARRSAAYLRAALLEPNAAVPAGFLMVSVTTAGGKLVRGVRLNEDPFSIQLRDASQRFHSFRKADLKEVKKAFGVSTMPSYKDAFTAAELDDLVAYLASLRGESRGEK